MKLNKEKLYSQCRNNFYLAFLGLFVKVALTENRLGGVFKRYFAQRHFIIKYGDPASPLNYSVPLATRLCFSYSTFPYYLNCMEIS